MGDCTDLLIDFSSPVPSKVIPLFQNSPLIPCPLGTNPVIDNPFDIVATCVDDPFDFIPPARNNGESDNEYLKEHATQNEVLYPNKENNTHVDDQKKCLSLNLEIKHKADIEETGVSNVLISEINEDCHDPEENKAISRPTIPPVSAEPSLCSPSTESSNACIGEVVKINEESNASADSSRLNDSSETSVCSTSLELGKNCNIAEVIAKRVNACIQKALNLSVHGPSTSSPLSPPKGNEWEKAFPDVSTIDSNAGSVLNRSLPSQTAKVTHPCFSTSFDSSNKQNCRIKSSSLDSLTCHNEVNRMFSEHKNEIQTEALKVSRKFKLLSQLNSGQMNIDDDNNIFNTPPPTELLDMSCSFEESGDEGNDDVGLPKLKLFCRSRSEGEFNLSSSSINPDIVSKFKKFRASLDNSTASCDSPALAEDNTFVAEETDTKKREFIAIKKPVMLNMKPKKKSDSANQKGPLKAVLPLQHVMRSGPSKASPTKCSSKVLGMNKNNVSKDSSFNGSLIKPVAASTPQKSTQFAFPSHQSRRERLPSQHYRSSSASSTTPSKLSDSLSYKSKGSVNGNKPLSRPNTAPSNGTGRVLASIKNSPQVLKRSSKLPFNLRKPSGKVVPDKENRITT